MKNSDTMRKLKIFCNLLLILAVVVGIALNFLEARVPKGLLMYFTIQSNILIALICVVATGYTIKKKATPRVVYLIKYIFTVAIVMTGLVFNLILVPQIASQRGSMEGVYSLSSILLHVVSPILGFVSYVFFDKSPFKKKFDLYGIIVPFAYFLLIIGLSMVKGLYLFDTLDGEPTKFPYFFLNYIDNGWFTLSSNIAELGTFYWFIIMIIFVVVLSLIMRFVQKKVSQTKFYRGYVSEL